MIYGYQRSARFVAFLTGTMVLAASARSADHVQSRSWWAFEADGDKPGNGFVVIERGGKVENAHFFIFLPDSPEDQSGRFIQMSHIKQDGKVLLAEIKGLEEPRGPSLILESSFAMDSTPASEFALWLLIPI